MNRKYKNSPLKEVVCEFRFNLSSEFEAEKIDLFYEQIKEYFPIKKEGFAVSVQVNIDSKKTKQEEVSRTEVKFEHYLSKDEKSFVQLDKNRVSIHRSSPYVSWQEFSPLIGKVHHAYVSTFEPANVIRAGLRYINEFSLSTDSKNLKDYFNLEFTIPMHSIGKLNSYSLGAVFQSNDEKNGIRILMGNTLDTSFVLDLDFFNLVENTLNVSDLPSWAELAHSQIEETFEAIISDKARQLID